MGKGSSLSFFLFLIYLLLGIYLHTLLSRLPQRTAPPEISRPWWAHLSRVSSAILGATFWLQRWISFFFCSQTTFTDSVTLHCHSGNLAHAVQVFCAGAMFTDCDQIVLRVTYYIGGMHNQSHSLWGEAWFFFCFLMKEGEGPGVWKLELRKFSYLWTCLLCTR